MDQRRTGSGHVSLIVTDLCASGIDQLRECRAGEHRGAVITTYASLATDYEKSVFVIPVLDHFTATNDRADIPVLTDGDTLRAAQIEYWRKSLKPYFPPLTQKRYDEIRRGLKRFDAGRTVRRLAELEFLGTVLGGHSKSESTEPIAMTDPKSGELIPDGRWREAVGIGQVRSSVIVTAPASIEQELRLNQYIQGHQSDKFNAVTDNCSDFAEGGLLAVLEDSGLRFRPRRFDLVDAWVTTPLSVLTGFVHYTRKNEIPIHLAFVPITAGTRRSHFSVTTLSRGALVPDPSQGMLAFGFKAYVNVLNPLLGVTAFTVDRLSGMENLPKLIHDCSDGDFLSTGSGPRPCSGNGFDQRDRVRVFGNSLCWKDKQESFQEVISQGAEVGVLGREAAKLILRRGQPFLFARFYERLAASSGRSILSAMGECTSPECAAGQSPELVPVSSQSVPDAPIPGRSQIHRMADSSEKALRETAFRLMAAVINFDLSAEPEDRRSVQAFDQDWRLFLHAAEDNDLAVPAKAAETLEACSCRSFDSGLEYADIRQEARSLTQSLLRGQRELFHGPVR